MVRNNNMIPNGHFHKKWKKHLKTWFDQPMNKMRRKLRRTTKAMKKAPRPINLLRPIVHCPSFRYNSRLRAGRGFTLRELKAAKINKHFARTIGIAVDQRRRNRSLESVLVNKQRLVEYKSKLILNTKKAAPCVTQTRGINKIKQVSPKLSAKVPTAEEKKFSAFTTLRKARVEQKLLGKRLRRKAAQSEDDGLKISSRKKAFDMDE